MKLVSLLLDLFSNLFTLGWDKMVRDFLFNFSFVQVVFFLFFFISFSCSLQKRFRVSLYNSSFLSSFSFFSAINAVVVLYIWEMIVEDFVATNIFITVPSSDILFSKLYLLYKIAR